jgi:methionine-rich copper-binding protein CopC
VAQACVETALLMATGAAAAHAQVSAGFVVSKFVGKTAKETVQLVAERVLKTNFQAAWKDLAESFAKQALKEAKTWAPVFAKYSKELAEDAFYENAKDHFRFVVAEATVNQMQKGKIASMIKAMNEKFIHGQKDPDDFAKSFESTLLNVVDFTGIKNLVEKVGDDKSSTSDEVKAWLDVFALFDPTGWLSVASNLAHPICADKKAEIAEAASKGTKKAGRAGGKKGR